MNILRLLLVVTCVALMAGCSLISSQDPNLPKGLSRGAWAIEDKGDSPAFLFLRDGKILTVRKGAGTYELVDENTLKVIFPENQVVFIETSEPNDSYEKLLVTITSDSSSSPESFVIRKILDDTSTGNYEKDLRGQWHFLVDRSPDKRTIEFLEDGTGVITDESGGERSSFTYEVIEDKLTLITYDAKEESAIFTMVNLGDPILLLPEGGGNREAFLIKSSEVLEMFER